MQSPIENFLPRRTPGFSTGGAEGAARAGELLRVPEGPPLTLKDFGLVPLTIEPYPTHDFVRADIVISEHGIPMKSLHQIKEEREARQFAMVQGRPIPPIAAELYVEDVSSYRGDQGRTFTQSHIYGLPSSVIFWAMGGKFLDILRDPFLRDSTPHPSFDPQTRRYSPNPKELHDRGYGPEGQRRLFMLGTMTYVISYANGVPRVQANPERCEVLVRFNPGDGLKAKDVGRVAGFLYSLSGIAGVTQEGQIVDVRSLDRFPPDIESAYHTAAELTKALLDQDRIDRPAISAGASKASSIFQ